MRRNLKKGSSIALITLMYVFAMVVGIFVFKGVEPFMHKLWAVFLADVVATVLIWGCGVVWRNVSVYDPYWSVAPPVIFTLWAFYKSCWTLPVILLLIAVWYWGIRLTGNWAVTFQGLGHEDWRYTQYREKQAPLLFQLTNLFGLNMMPTVLVFACMLPGFGLFAQPGAIRFLTVLGFVVCLSSATIQLIADTQIHHFRAAHPGEPCTAGLWKHGRHPNYFGEVQFWWGIWLMYASLNGLDWLVLSPIAMTALFLFISIPMMEKRQLARKPAYAAYRKNTRILI
jgi:steroid 5-alpha reductase family enzyme